MTKNSMEDFSFGDICLLKFPFANGTRHKKRPVLVLLDTQDDDIIVCRITSRMYHTKFDFQVNNWTEAGLKLPSVIRLHKIATLEKKLVYKKMGKINEPLKRQIKNSFNQIIK